MSRSVVGVALVAAAAAVVVVVVGREHVPASAPAAPALPAPPAPAFRISAPRLLSEAPPAGRWTTIVRPVPARAQPTANAPPTALLETRTPERTANVVLVLARRTDPRGRLWVRVRMPGFPGSGTGWVPRSALGAYHAVRTRLVVDLDERTATLLRSGRPVFRAPVGVGRAVSPTPRGEFYVRSRLTRFESPFYGPIAFGTSARAPSLTDWPGGGFIGIHGTDRPELLPGRVSHGCIRLRNADILRLAELMPVGTPISIR